MAINGQLVANRFFGIDRNAGSPRIHIGESRWKIESVVHIAADPALPESRFGRIQIPEPGSLIRKAGRAANWFAEYCTATCSVALIGTRSRLESELELLVGWAGREGRYDRLRDILRPDDGRSPTWASAILPAGSGDLPEVPAQARLAVLDGATAIRWMPELRTPLVVPVIDRSSTDESAISTVLQVRSTGRPVELEALRWHPMPGMEALAFEVRI
ncbi:hypothetical protein [Carbonactinospora thermoautotrophica]|uniref:hypothetical protein n=1 Tax=Carbonactinospora thermoautotrophica TaxID=1469144 RepID=UPI0013012D46|nr:hypothetical protein [Carbonactinospora thermoautotrophica]